ncbi:MAG: hypothetical protein WBP72_01375 [Rhodocyclaceae bacterium]
MKTPKMLPWLARRHGVPAARAEEMWVEALRHATTKTGWVGTSDYWGAAVEHLVEALEAEASLRPPLTDIVQTANRIGFIPLIVWQGFADIVQASWKRAAKPIRFA